MDDKIKVVYNWIGPRGPVWNTEVPNIFTLANASEQGRIDSSFFNVDSTWLQLFSNNTDMFDMYPSVSIRVDDDRPFIIPFTLFWRIEFTHYFCGRTGLLEFAHTPQHLINLVKHRNGYILIDHGVEAFMSDHQLSSMHGYFKGIHQMPLHKIIYLTGAVNSKQLYSDYCMRHNIPDTVNDRLTIMPYASGGYIFKPHIQNRSDEPTYNTDTVPEKLFLSWNRRFRDHRIELALHLEQLNLVEKSYISFSKTHVENHNDSFLSRANGVLASNKYANEAINVEVVNRFDNRLPLVLDNEHDIVQMCGDHDHRSRPYYQNSLVSLVTETTFADSAVALTEKSFKPFKEKHPFILVAGAGALNYLRTLGFKTFSEFWPESYDSPGLSPDERMKRIRSVLKIISSWDHDQILTFKQKVKPILEHNFNQLKNLSVNMLLDDVVKIVRKDIK